MTSRKKRNIEMPIPPLERDRSVTLTNAGSYLPIAFFGDRDLTTNALGMANPGNKTRTAYTHGPR